MARAEKAWIKGFRAGLHGDPREWGYTGEAGRAFWEGWNDGHALRNDKLERQYEPIRDTGQSSGY